MAKRKRDPRRVAMDYMLLEMGWDSVEVYGSQNDPSQPYTAVWLKGEVDGEQATIGILVDTANMEVCDEFDPNEAGQPGELRSGRSDPLGGPVYFG